MRSGMVTHMSLCLPDFGLHLKDVHHQPPLGFHGLGFLSINVAVEIRVILSKYFQFCYPTFLCESECHSLRM